MVGFCGQFRLLLEKPQSNNEVHLTLNVQRPQSIVLKISYTLEQLENRKRFLFYRLLQLGLEFQTHSIPERF